MSQRLHHYCFKTYRASSQLYVGNTENTINAAVYKWPVNLRFSLANCAIKYTLKRFTNEKKKVCFAVVALSLPLKLWRNFS